MLYRPAMIALVNSLFLMIGCATVKPPVEARPATISTPFFIVKGEPSLEIGYVKKVDPHRNLFAAENYHVVPFDGGTFCEIEGPRSEDLCFAFDYTEGEIVVTPEMEVFIRYRISPGCYGIYQAHAIAPDEDFEAESFRGQLYDGRVPENQRVRFEGTGCVKHVQPERPVIKT